MVILSSRAAVGVVVTSVPLEDGLRLGGSHAWLCKRCGAGDAFLALRPWECALHIGKIAVAVR